MSNVKVNRAAGGAGILIPCVLTAIAAAIVLPGNAAAQSKPAGADIVESQNAFAFKLYSQLAAKDGNLFFSPFSVHHAMSMSWCGADGATVSQMADVLGLVGGNRKVAKELAAFRQRLLGVASHKADSSEFRIANGMWYAKDLKVRADYLSLIKDDFNGEMKSIDFSDPQDAAQEINDWVADKTKKKINDIVPPSAIDPVYTKLVLANAVYFYSDWECKFKENETRSQPFYVAENKRVNVSMMNQTEGFNYAETDDAQLLEMPYVDGKRSMVIILPKEKDGMAKVEKTLGEKLPAAMKAMENGQVSVSLPRFAFSYDNELSDELVAMGMKDAFGHAANFSLMTDGSLFIKYVFHKAYVDVCEEGTEAAAATAVIYEQQCASLDRPKIFNADHPFIFLIRDESGAIIFMGRVVEPKYEKMFPGFFGELAGRGLISEMEKYLGWGGAVVPLLAGVCLWISRRRRGIKRAIVAPLLTIAIMAVALAAIHVMYCCPGVGLPRIFPGKISPTIWFWTVEFLALVVIVVAWLRRRKSPSQTPGVFATK